MGKHQETGGFDRPLRSGWFGRAATAALIAAAAFFSYGFQSWTIVPAADSASGSLPRGDVAPVLLETTRPTPTYRPIPAAEPMPAIRTDPKTLVSFDRSPVDTIARDGTHRLTLASQDLQRPAPGTLRAPLEVLNPSSGFGLRIDPITGAAGEFHWGQDFAAACGIRVYAADTGVVRAVGWHPWGGGNRVEIDHGNGLITTYNHLEAIGVRTGESVKVGEVIARVGTTGSSTGCHLHFETIVNGIHTNPMNWTLLPIRQLDLLDDIPMVSYAPGGNAPASEAPVWAVPVGESGPHTATGGKDEKPVDPSPTPSNTAPPSPTPSPSGTATPSPGGTATPSPSGTATPSPGGTATPSPSGTATPSPSGTATPSPSGTATPSPSPSGTETPSPTAPTPIETDTPSPSTGEPPTESVPPPPVTVPAPDPSPVLPPAPVVEPSMVPPPPPVVEPAPDPSTVLPPAPPTEKAAEPAEEPLTSITPATP